MTNDRQSRYAKSERTEWRRADGARADLIAPTPRPARAFIFSVTATDTDRLDSLAAKYYRDPQKQWKIADAADALDPFDAVIPGAPIDIPPDK